MSPSHQSTVIGEREEVECSESSNYNKYMTGESETGALSHEFSP